MRRWFAPNGAAGVGNPMTPDPKELAPSSADDTGMRLPRLFFRRAEETRSARAHALGLLIVIAELGLLLLLFHRFHVESGAFRAVLTASSLGFVIHHLLPQKSRLGFFVALSILTTGYVLGLERGAWTPATGLPRLATLIGVGGFLIGICHLPLSFRARVTMLVAVGSALAVVRVGWVEFPSLGALWPVLGAMFMFRLAIYIYDLQHEKEPMNPARTLAYFFMLPNVCFPLFPVIDYKTFARNYFKEDTFEIYQRGVSWMTRGLIQLLLFRLVYYHVHVGPQFVRDGADLVRFLLSNVLLYMRVSGQFHVVVGLLHLFGFGLPLTNNRYFLASSFTDYWRRVNIYWKDFILKMVFYPTMFRMKRWNQTRAMIAATVIAFVVTWALHSYQWFWLRGQFPISAQDCFFWGLFGIIVTGNTIYEQKKGRQRVLGKKSLGLAERLVLAGKTAATFVALTLLWSIWNAQSMSQWMSIMRLADRSTVLYGLLASIAVMIATLLLETGPAKASATGRKLPSPRAPGLVPIFPFQSAIFSVGLPALLILVVSSGRVARHLGPEAELVVQSLSNTQPNAADKADMERGYYEDLMDVSRFNSKLNEALTSQPADWRKLEETDAEQPSNDHRVVELVPAKETTVNGKLIKTNSLGLRDREYPLEKPPGVYRIALMGSSHVFGFGVQAEESFESRLEVALNRTHANAPHTVYEVLNFGVNGYSPICQLAVLDKKVRQTKPDAVWFVAHANDPFWTMQRFGKAIRKGFMPPYPFLVELANQAEIDARTPELWAQRKLMPHWKEMVAFAYREIVFRARAMGAQPVYIFLPGILERGPLTEDTKTLLELASEAGFERVILSSDIFQNEPADALEVAPWDAHPNAKGHALIAAGLMRAVDENPRLDIFKAREGGAREGSRTATSSREKE